jgi:hypothetical protein
MFERDYPGERDVAMPLDNLAESVEGGGIVVFAPDHAILERERICSMTVVLARALTAKTH